MELKGINHIHKELERCEKDGSGISVGVIVNTETGDTRTMLLFDIYEVVIPEQNEIVVIFDRPASQEEIEARIRRQLALHPPDRRVK